MRWCFLVLFMPALGCTSLGSNSQADFEKMQKRREAVLAKPAPPPIQPDQVTDKNAHRLAQDLLDEMDRDTNQALQATGPTRLN